MGLSCRNRPSSEATFISSLQHFFPEGVWETWALLPPESLPTPLGRGYYERLREAALKKEDPPPLPEAFASAAPVSSLEELRRLAEEVEKEGLRARLQKAARAILERPGEDPGKLARDVILLLSSLPNGKERELDGKEMARLLLRRQEERKGHGLVHPDHVRTGFPAFDAWVKGLIPGEVTVLTGPSGGKKSLLALNWLANVCLGADGRPPERLVPGLYVSLELPPEQVLDRLHCILTGAAPVNVAMGGGDPRKAARALERGMLSITGDAPKTLSDVEALLRRRAALDGLRFAVVDYFANIAPEPGERGDLATLVERVRRLEALAKELEIHLVVVNQLNREYERNGNGGPARRYIANTIQLLYTAGYVVSLGRDDRGLFLRLDKCRYADWPVVFRLVEEGLRIKERPS